MIDVGFDFRRDAKGRDPDSYSPTLRRYHCQLWNKPLPSGVAFELSMDTPGAYLYHHTALGEFRLSSDSVMATFTRRKSVQPIIEHFPLEEIDWFNTITYTMGGMMIFPSNQIEHKMTINAARGLLRPISDRFDLTLECIRRHYLGQSSPLDSVLLRYADFFALFNDFNGYVNFFLLGDLVSEHQQIDFFMPFDDFRSSPIPTNVETYREFMKRSINFVAARNNRIERYSMQA